MCKIWSKLTIKTPEYVVDVAFCIFKTSLAVMADFLKTFKDLQKPDPKKLNIFDLIRIK